MRNLDGVRENKNFLILANTNRKDVLDRAVVDRFRQQLYIPLPDKETRRKLFETKLEEIEEEFYSELDFEILSECSEGLSGREITFICDDLKYYLSGIKANIVEGGDVLSYLENLIAERLKSRG